VARRQHPEPLEERHHRNTGLTIVESPVLGNGHAGFGRRPGETGWSQGQHRAPGRPYNAKTHHGWTWNTDPTTGDITWTSPTGHDYTKPREHDLAA
jgi:hypothetical protein